MLGIKAENIEGEEIRKVVALPMGPGRDGRERIRNAGVTLVPQGEDIQVAAVKFGSLARKLGLDQGATIAELKLPNPARPAVYWVFIPGALVALGVWWWQGFRQRPVALPGRAAP